MKKNEKGFAALEAVLVVIILGILGFTGWFVLNAKQNADKSLSSNTSATPVIKPGKANDDAYAGWKTYTLKNEKLTFKYPSNWNIQYESSSDGIDNASFESADGFKFGVSAGTNSIAPPDSTSVDCNPNNYGTKKILASQQVKLDTQRVSIIYLSEYSCVDKAQTEVVEAKVVPDAKDQYSYIKAKNAKDSVKEGTSTLWFNMSYDASGPHLTASNVMNDKEYQNAKLVIESMSY